MAVSVHPGVVKTDLVNGLGLLDKVVVYVGNYVRGVSLLEPEQGAFSQLWAAAGAKRSELVNGAFYKPVGVLGNKDLDRVAKSEDFAKELWTWTDGVLDSIN
jgi:hypothetical protein